MGGHPCLVPDCRGKAFSSTLLRIMLAVGLSYMAFVFFFLMCLKHLMVLQSIFIDAVSYVTLTVTCVVGVTTPVSRGESGSGGTHRRTA